MQTYAKSFNLFFVYNIGVNCPTVTGNRSSVNGKGGVVYVVDMKISLIRNSAPRSCMTYISHLVYE